MSQQSIPRPHGVTAFGSHVMRVRPDLALIRLAVTRLDANPAKALTATRTATKAVREEVARLGVPAAEVRSSQITLLTQFEHTGGRRKFSGHLASVEVIIALSDIGQLEAVLVGAVDAGADQVRAVQFKSKALPEHRADARRRAVLAARGKAELYAEAAGVKLGAVQHIEDVDPTTMARREYGHAGSGDVIADDDVGTYDPGTINVSGSVFVSYAIL